jgi:beta-N-acetylhexosaminidase
VTGDNTPASLSRHWISTVLRKRIGYRGLVISDDLEMGGVLAAGSIGDVAVETLRAGADMFLVCHKEEHVWAAYRAVLGEAEKDRKFAKLVASAAARVAESKKRFKSYLKFPSEPSARTVRKQREAVTRLVESVGEAQA